MQVFKAFLQGLKKLHYKAVDEGGLNATVRRPRQLGMAPKGG
jgi:hypothetical protein